MKKIICYLLTFTCLIAITMCGVNNNPPPKKGKEKTDSLFEVLKKANADTNKVNTLNALAYEYRNTNHDSSLYFAKEAKALAMILHDEFGIADSYLNIGRAEINTGKNEDGIKTTDSTLKLFNRLLVSDKSISKTRIQKKIADTYLSNGCGYQNLKDFSNALKSFSASLKISEEIGCKEDDYISLRNTAIVYSSKSDFSNAVKYYSASLKIAQEMEDSTRIAGSYLGLGTQYLSLGNYPEALNNWNNALKTYKETGDKKGISNVYNAIGYVYTSQGNYPEALKNELNALKIKEEIGDKKSFSSTYNNIGNVYLLLKEYSKALEYYSASLKISEESGDKDISANIYCDLGVINFNQNKFPEALMNFTKSLDIYKETKYKSGIAIDLENIGNVYYRQKKYPEALKNQLASMELRKETGEMKGLAHTYNNIGETYYDMRSFDKANEFLNKGLLLSKDIGSFQDLIDSYAFLTTLDSTKGDFKKAFEDYKMSIVYTDSINNEDNTKKLVQTQMQYDFDKKEAATKAEQDKKDALSEADLQKQKALRNIFLGGFAVVLLFAVVFFMQRRRISKEKKRSDDLLLNILPAEVAEELKEKGSADAKQFDDVTVMFTDFKGFTQISEKLTPAELVAEIHTCFKAFDNIIGKHNIEKIKTIGDSYMCAGGLPVANKTNANDVVDAALEISQFMLTYLEQRKSEGKEPFEIRIGVHTGPVVAGIVGVKKFAYDIWGDTVNVASRMESSGEVGRVNISGATHDIVKDLFLCEYRGKVMAKNKGEIDMYFVEKKLLN